MASLVVNTFPQAFLKVLHHSLQHVGRNCCHFFPDVLFQIHHCPWFLFVHLALEISSEEEVSWLGTLVPMNIEVPTKYPLRQDRIVVFENRLHSKSPMLYRPALHGNWNALSLASRVLKEKFPTPKVPLTTVLQNSQVFLPDPISGFATGHAGQRRVPQLVKHIREKDQQDAPLSHQFIPIKFSSTCFRTSKFIIRRLFLYLQHTVFLKHLGGV